MPGVRRDVVALGRAVSGVWCVEHARCRADAKTGAAPGGWRRSVAGEGAVSLAEVSATAARPMPTGVSELDRVMGGGVVGGSVTLLFGPPGIGKSTLLFQVLASVAARGLDVMLASAEESLAQVSGRAARLGPVPAPLLALEGPDVDAIEEAVDRALTGPRRRRLVAVDLGLRAAPAGRQPGPGAGLCRATDAPRQVERRPAPAGRARDERR